MVIASLAEEITRGVETVSDRLSETLFEPVIRLGVTGLARAGKTVFITSLVANLLDRGRMPGLAAQRDGRIAASFLQPQPDDTVPRFDFETHLAALTGPAPHWPDNTRAISELRLSFRVAPAGLLAGLKGSRRVHLDIVDYPGEWLLDLALLDQDYAGWADATLARLAPRPEAAGFRAALAAADPQAPHEETRARDLAALFAETLTALRAQGLHRCTPGRFLQPGDLAGSPVLTFAPLPAGESFRRGSLGREMERRFEAYKAQVVKPFFRDHFARIDRQVVLVDALEAIHAGPAAVADMQAAMAEILAAFRPGPNAFLTRLLRGRRVERILFAATKADHIHHSQHARLTAIIEALTRQARDRAQFAGAETRALALAALRATTEETRDHAGRRLDCVRGTLLNPDGSRGRQAALFPGTLPADPARIGAAGEAGGGWLADGEFTAMRFAPAPLDRRPGDGLPHFRLDQAAQFLIGDRL